MIEERSIPGIFHRPQALIAPIPLSEHPYFGTERNRPLLRPSVRTFNWSNAWWFAEASLAAYLDEAQAQEIFGRVGFHLKQFSTPQGMQAYVVYNDQLITLVFRGTELRAGVQEGVRDWVNNLQFDLVAVRDLPGRVHTGFGLGALTLHKQMFPFVHGLQKKLRRPVWLAGHSQGGALATISALRFPNVQGVFTYGAPRVGDSVFADSYQINHWRICNNNDPVVRLPLEALGYEHVGCSVLLKDNGQPVLNKEPVSTIFVDPIDHAPISYCNLAWHLAQVQS
jgi:triacylglycerol lipase